MQTLSISMVVELNKLLAHNDLEFKIHLSDTCGKQSLWIDSNIPISSLDKFYPLMEAYFEKYNITLQYNANKTSFWITNKL